MSPRSPDQNEEIRQQTRQQINDAAFELFAKNGYANTSIAAVAKKAGVSKGLIYHYFNNKEEILQSIFEQMTEISDDIFGKVQEMKPEEKFKSLINQVFQQIEEHPGLMRLMVSLALQPDAIESIKPMLEGSTKNQIAAMQQILQELNYDDSEGEAYYIAAKLDGILMGYLSIGEDYPLEDLKQKLINEYV